MVVEDEENVRYVAAAALRLAGLKVAEVRYRTYSGVGPGVVLRQVPPAGHKVSPQGQISLEISKVEP